MAYRLISGRPLAQEIQRLVDHETMAATAGLTPTAAADRAHRVHDARRHIKKARTLLWLARTPLGRGYADATDTLRTANRALGALADAHRVPDTLAAAHSDGVVRVPVATYAAMRVHLQRRASEVERGAAVADLPARTARLLTSLRRQMAAADLRDLDRGAIVAALRDAHAAARKTRRRADTRPSVDTFHTWRRAIKREWHLMRLISALTGDHLRDERHQLATLDACLGELHDVDVLIAALAASSPLSRAELAPVLASLRRQAKDLRRLAHRWSAVLDERPRQLARRVRVLWGAAPRRRNAAAPGVWRHSA